MVKARQTWILAWVLCALTGVAFAQSGGALKLTNAVYQELQVKAPDGKVTRKRVPAANVIPGDEVIYEISYSNAGKTTATDVVINNPVPKGLVFVAADTPVTAVSVDGGKRFGALEELSVAGTGGATRPALTADVTNLRWTIAAIKPGQAGKVTFRARVR